MPTTLRKVHVQISEAIRPLWTSEVQAVSSTRWMILTVNPQPTTRTAPSAGAET